MVRTANLWSVFSLGAIVLSLAACGSDSPAATSTGVGGSGGQGAGAATGGAPGDGGSGGGKTSATSVTSATTTGTGGALEVEPPFPMPVIRVGPRSASGAFYGPGTFAGTVEVPATTKGFASFEGLEVYGHGIEGGPVATLGATTLEGGVYKASFTVELTHASDQYVAARELFTALVPAQDLVLLGPAFEPGKLEFTVASTALAALAVARVPFGDPISNLLEEASYFGVAPGDDPALDAAAPAVAMAMRASLEAGDGTGVDRRGGVRPDSPVFTAVDAGLAAKGAPQPVLSLPASTERIGAVTNATAGHFAFFAPDYGPLPTFEIPEGVTSFGVLFYALNPGLTASTLLYARQALAQGNYGPASPRFGMAAPAAVQPPTPTLEGSEVEGAPGLRASGVTAGNWVLFIDASTELSVGFAVRYVGPSATSVELPGAEVPEGAIVRALQVDAERVVSLPSESVFF